MLLVQSQKFSLSAVCRGASNTTPSRAHLTYYGWRSCPEQWGACGVLWQEAEEHLRHDSGRKIVNRKDVCRQMGFEHFPLLAHRPERLFKVRNIDIKFRHAGTRS